MRMHDLDDLVNQAEMCRISGSGQSTVAMWRYRYSDFPKPLIQKKRNVQLWSRAEFEKWFELHKQRMQEKQKFDPKAFDGELNA